MTATCRCGGATFVDSFDWPGKLRQWFRRCESCCAMSKAVATSEEADCLTVQWSIPAMWKGKTVAILASGPSMSQAVAYQLRADRIPAIVVNTTFQLAPWADLLYGADAKWWNNTSGAKDFAGLKVSCQPVMGVLTLSNFGLVGYSDDPTGFHTYGNSGAQAIQIAAKGGASRILLHGFDMHGSHWHGDHPQPLEKTSQATREKWIRNMQFLAEELAKRSVEVVNCTPGSALTCFPTI